jgi:NADH:ubiquinone oxidoreductase subunit 4 (subunit M)
MLRVSYVFAYPILLRVFLIQGRRLVLPLRFLVRALFLKGFLLRGESRLRSHYQGLFRDSIRIIFCVLSVLVVLVSSAATVRRRKSRITVNFLISLIRLLLLFSTNNLMSYFLLFELSLVPLYFLIAFWGRQYERVLSNYYFILFSVVTSVPLFLIVCEIYSERCLEYSALSLLLPSRYQVSGL